MLGLDRKSKNIEVGRPFVKMSMNWEVLGTCRTQTSQMVMHPQMKWRLIATCFVLVLNGFVGEVDGADVVVVDESAL
jgi:hypothetical protein